MSFDVNFMMVALKAALEYTPTTLMLALVSFGVGIVLGTLIAVARVYRIKVISRAVQVFVVVVKGIPVVLILLIVYFLMNDGLNAFAKTFHLGIRSKDISLNLIALVALSIFATANISEAIRGALVSVDKGQYEAAYSVGLTRIQALRRIILKQALPVAVPMLCSSLIGLIKGSSLAFMISVTDLLNGALITATANYRFLEAYIAAAIVYWVINFSIERIAALLEKRLKVYSREGVR